jgi:hypothetical protein
MIPSSYYLQYSGPPLLSCHIDGVDITDKLSTKYGKDHNWQGCLWTYKELFGPDCQGKQVAFVFQAEGHTTWFHRYIQDIHQYMNPPISHDNHLGYVRK